MATDKRSLLKPVQSGKRNRLPLFCKGFIPAGAMLIPQLTTQLTAADRWGAFKTRLGFGRMRYRIDPGLYAIGNPTNDSPVLITANYKLTVDIVRKNLKNINAWLIILDTKGVNVWCAAGKGIFSTDAVVKAVKETNLAMIVTHRTLILPQLSATGVAAHTVRKETGFSVVYGPVKIDDIKPFFADQLKKTEPMRTVYFPLKDRLRVAPVELINAWKVLLPGMILYFLLALLGHKPVVDPLLDLAGLFGAVIVGTLIFPILLPLLPGKPFALKGGQLGVIWSIGYAYLFAWSMSDAFAQTCIISAVTAFGALNFTGSSTFTSLSGVQKEMKVALPAIIITAVIGIVCAAIAYL